MSLINISHLTFAYDGSYDNIFTDVSFQLDTDWKLGFCGRNGRGKTTFLRLLLSQFEYQGSISASVDFEYFPYQVEDPAQNTLDILSAIAPDAPLWRIQKEIFKLAVTEDALYRPFSTLSNGEQTKVLLAGLFLRENSFLLIDEPTNHLDMDARETVARYLDGKSGFILVSHDRAFLDECVDHVLSINKANIEIQNGNFSSWWHNKQMQDEYEMAENDRLKREITHLETAVRRTAAWSDSAERRKIGFDPAKTEKSKGRRPYEGEKSRKMMARSKAIQDRQQSSITEKSKLLRNIETAEALKLRPLTYHTSRMLSVDNLSVAYDGVPVFRGMAFSLHQGDRIALRGGNGCGKSSLLKLICGEEIPHSGAVTTGSRLIVSYVPQDASFLAGDLDEYASDYGVDGTLFKTILRKLDFARVQFEKDMRDYSAGQKKKVLLARSLCEQAHLYVWDEPLNYIDVLSRMQIEELIMAYTPTLLFVEHDRAFCDNIATKTVLFSK
ncbi:MAG: ABC-F type ribosomal protection protein [Oscillospiraceae bacterium]|jgi:lincosamide and streptogramin A transport system ATP-binding/permease protein|nr:ABC-F type ribosomal protection protein [Oscillospiraceae bacterium]